MDSVAILARSVLRVRGADAEPFLQNLLTQNVARLASQPALYAALLSPQGKLLSDFILWRAEDGILIDVAENRAADLLRRLSMFRLRAKVEVDDVSDSWDVAAGPPPANAAIIARDPRLAALGGRAIIPRAAPGETDTARYEAWRIGLGVADPALDSAPEEVFGLEALLEEFDGVDFQKGCFVGQENVSRMKRRATTRKKFCPATFDGEAPEYGAAVENQAGVEIGSIRSGISGRAIALLRLDRAREAEALSVAARPLRLDPPAWLIQPDDSAP